MKKRWFISLIIGIIMVISGCLGYLQYGRDMDVYGSYAMTVFPSTVCGSISGIICGTQESETALAIPSII